MNRKFIKEQINETAKRVYSYMITDHSQEALKLTQKNAVDCHAGNWGMRYWS